jgi:hypothetical protein
MMRYAFVNPEGIVVQVIVGALSEQQQQQFLADYSALFGASQIVAVYQGQDVWIGGSYTDGQFLPAAAPEPAPEPQPEPLPEPEPEPEI